MKIREAIKTLEDGAWWDSLPQDMSDADMNPLQDALNMAIAALRAQQEAEENEPLTLDELKQHLSCRHPHEIEPLYVIFNPPIPIDYAPRWRGAYNLSQLVASSAKDYGKTWLAYRRKPEDEHS